MNNLLNTHEGAVGTGRGRAYSEYIPFLALNPCMDLHYTNAWRWLQNKGSHGSQTLKPRVLSREEEEEAIV